MVSRHALLGCGQDSSIALPRAIPIFGTPRFTFEFHERGRYGVTAEDCAPTMSSTNSGSST